MKLNSFGTQATQHWVQGGDTRFNVVTAGKGPPIVLVAGWPQSLWAWRHVFPRLAERYCVYALDLPGIGDSAPAASSYDVLSISDSVYAALEQLGLRSYCLVGHDIGAWIGYPMAARRANAVKKLVLMDAVIPGVVPMVPITPQNALMAWHFGFNSIPELPEALTEGRERVFLSWFFRHRAFIKSAFNEADLDEYERIYSSPGVMTSGFSYYRCMGRSAEQNRALSTLKLEMPVLVVAGARGVGPRMIDAVLPLCAKGHGVAFENCGHYIPEEAPEQLVPLLQEFIEQH